MRLVAILLLIGLFVAPPAHADKPIAAFLGDSYTQGWAVPPDSRWSTLVAQAMGWDERNFGAGGSGYWMTGRGGAPYPQRLDPIVAVNPSIVVVAGGLNDRRQDPTARSQAVHDTYTKLRALLPDVRIIAVGPTYFGDVTPDLIAFDAEVHDAANSVGAQYVSLIFPTYVLRSDMFLPDGLHVDAEGHEAIAGRVVDVLR